MQSTAETLGPSQNLADSSNSGNSAIAPHENAGEAGAASEENEEDGDSVVAPRRWHLGDHYKRCAENIIRNKQLLKELGLDKFWVDIKAATKTLNLKSKKQAPQTKSKSKRSARYM